MSCRIRKIRTAPPLHASRVPPDGQAYKQVLSPWHSVHFAEHTATQWQCRTVPIPGRIIMIGRAVRVTGPGHSHGHGSRDTVTSSPATVLPADSKFGLGAGPQYPVPESLRCRPGPTDASAPPGWSPVAAASHPAQIWRGLCAITAWISSSPPSRGPASLTQRGNPSCYCRGALPARSTGPALVLT